MSRPRWPGVVSLVVAALFVIGVVQSGLAHPGFVAAHPFNVAWIATAVALATATFFLHRIAPPDRPRIALGAAARFAGFGAIGCVLAFTLQGIVNPALARLLGPGAPGIPGYVLLGIGAALCQTAGKWGAIAALHRVLRPASPHDLIALGLGVGLGFAAAEIVVTGQHPLAREAVLVPPAFWSLFERATAAGFHVFSGVLLAVGVEQGLRGIPWITAVVLLHSLLDGLAGAAGTGLVPLSLPVLELIFLVVAIDTWLLSLLATRPLPPRSSAAAPLAPAGA